MATPKTPLKTWLLLGLAVLVAHLVLLRALPLGLNLQAADAPLSFTTRTVLLAPAAPLTPTAPALAKPVKSRPPAKPALRTIAKQATPAPVALAPVESSAPATAEATSPETAANPAQSTVSAPAQPASAPEKPQPNESAPPLAAITQPAPVASAAATVAPSRPPRQRPPYFSAESLAGSVRLVYQVDANKFPFRLSAELSWHKLGDNYDARLNYSAFGQNRTQTSKGHITDTGLAPERFSDKYRSEQAAHFNYPRGVVTFSANTPDAPLLSGAQDRLSVLIQLGALVASEPERYGLGSTLTIQTFGARAGDLWLFTVEQTETLALPGGPLKALKLVRMPRELYDQKVEIWLAPALAYLPARVRITETNGDAIDQKWLSTETVDSPN